jgi:hypothetical protein
MTLQLDLCVYQLLPGRRRTRLGGHIEKAGGVVRGPG